MGRLDQAPPLRPGVGREPEAAARPAGRSRIRCVRVSSSRGGLRPQLLAQPLEDLLVPVVGAQQQVAQADDAGVGLGLGLVSDQVRPRAASRRSARTPRSNQVAGDLLAAHELTARLHQPGSPRPRRPPPGRRTTSRRGSTIRVAQLGRQRDALEEQPLVALQRQVVEPHAGVGADLGDDLGDVGLDHLEAQLPRDRYAVVAVADEVHVADPVDVDRRHRLAAAHRLRDPLPAPLARGGRWGGSCGRTRAGAVDRADDRVEGDRLQAQPALARAGRAPRPPRRTAGSG